MNSYKIQIKRKDEWLDASDCWMRRQEAIKLIFTLKRWCEDFNLADLPFAMRLIDYSRRPLYYYINK